MNKSATSVLGFGTLLMGSALALAADAPAAGGASTAAKAAVSGLAGASVNDASSEPLLLDADAVAFGSSAESVARQYDRWWDKQFVSRYRRTNPGPKMKELDFELAQKKKILRRVFKFDGRSATHDKATFREEFAHGNGETMSAVELVRPSKANGGGKGIGYTRRFFFFQDKLWKIYDEYELGPEGLFGPDFKQAAALVEASLGPSANRTRGADSRFESVTFDGPETRVRVVKLSQRRIALVRSDKALAQRVLDGRVQNAVAADDALDDDIQAVIR